MPQTKTELKQYAYNTYSGLLFKAPIEINSNSYKQSDAFINDLAEINVGEPTDEKKVLIYSMPPEIETMTVSEIGNLIDTIKGIKAALFATLVSVYENIENETYTEYTDVDAAFA